LQYLYDEKKIFHEQINLLENTALGVAPFFNAVGFDRPAQTTLVAKGKPQELLTAPRSAQQYNCQPNGADADESPLTLHMAAGQLDNTQIAQQLDQGIYINNLWYLNYSDRLAGRITGMTRFGCFWVDKGQLQSPIEVLRFDDSLYRMLGSELEGLTREAEVQISANTYGARSVESMKNPGALLREMKFTL